MTAANSTTGYTVLARRFRPQAFGEVVGQEHIAQALRNAIRGNRVAHAYLFTGARGVGKTSSARILAKALNCPTAVDGDPCNECEICQGISAGNDVDVLEIDGASNRGIDDIRQLRAGVNVKSMRTKFKVYIIDEVHMLTKEAFNALLKTLEEPPPYVIFIFCTTEPNKVPDTILSRCQRFDFGTIATNNIKLRLAQIAVAEGVQVDDGAFDLIARRAAGSMRDSQSIFDQLLAFGEQNITANDVHRLLGTASDDRLVAIVETLVSRNPAGTLDAFHAALEGGVQLGELTDQLLFYLRDLMVIAAGAANLELLAVSGASRVPLAQQAKRWGLQTIVAALQIMADAKARMQRVTYGRAIAELALVRVASLEDLANLGSLIEQLRSNEPVAALPGPVTVPFEKKNDLSHAVSQPVVAAPTPIPAPAPTPAAAPAPTPPPVAPPKPVPPPVPIAKSEPVRQPEPPRRTEPVAPSTPAPSTPAREARPQKAMPKSGHSYDSYDDSDLDRFISGSGGMSDSSNSGDYGDVAAEMLRAAIAEDEALSRPAGVKPAAPAAPAVRPAPAAVAAKPTPIATAPASASSSEPSSPAAPSSPLTIGAAELWAKVLADLNDLLKSHAKVAIRTAIVGPSKLEVTFPRQYNFSKTYCEKLDTLRRLEEIAARIAGQPVKIAFVLAEDEPSSESPTPTTASRSAEKNSRRSYKPEEDDFVFNVMNLFAAQVVKVEPIVAPARRADDSE